MRLDQLLETRFMVLFLLFVAIPLIEIALFVLVGGEIGLWSTLAVVILTAIVGTVLVRQQGLSTLRALRSSLAEGGDPAGHLAHGALILAAGIVLLTPGFFTDAVGLALLTPPVRTALIARGMRHFAGQMHVYRGDTARPARDTIITDADYTVEPDDEPPARPGRSGWTRPE
ncbi:MAG: FxsA family protein [Pseudomonadota bacterium]